MRDFVKLVGYDENNKPTGTVYTTTKNKKTMTKKLELRKYDKKLKKHTLFREAK